MRTVRTPTATRRAVITALGATLFSFLVAWSWIGAVHTPAPHQVKVAVVAPSPLLAELQTGLNEHAPGGFDLVAYPNQAQATTALKNGDLPGALIVTDPPTGPSFHLLTAGANGPLPSEVLTKAFGQIAAAQHVTMSTTDVVPLPTDDLIG